MKPVSKAQSGLDKKFQQILDTPASFAFFVAIHDFVQHIEANPELLRSLSPRLKINQELSIENKYNYLKQIYQGIEDINTTTNADLGHARYSVVRDLTKIQSNDVSDSNAFWKRREFSRKLADAIHKRMLAYFSPLENAPSA